LNVTIAAGAEKTPTGPFETHSLSRSTKEDEEEEEEEEEEEGRRSWGWETKGGVMREEDSLSELDAGALFG
jgi:hypothetical protein